jgi:hypothetical protein
MSVPDEIINFDLTKPEALVLLEFLRRFSDEEKLEISDQSEARVLWNMNSILESKLAEPFLPNYSNLVEEARESVRDDE